MKLIQPNRMLCLAAAVLLAGSTAAAQRGGGGMGGHMGGMGGGMGPGGNRGPMGMPGGPRAEMPRGGPPPNAGGGGSSTMRGGLQLGPPGRWWDDKKFAKSLGLNEDQQKRMDTVFSQNRDALVARDANLQRAEARLEELTHTSKPSETALFTEIDHVAQARADLEKAYTHMLLQIRDEMTPEQIGKLEDHR